MLGAKKGGEKDKDGVFPTEEISFKLKGAEITARFEDDKSVAVTGLPADITNAKATVSGVVGRGETSVVLICLARYLAGWDGYKL